MQLVGGILQGACEWFDPQGVTVASGTFRGGRPWDGTFLDWSRLWSDVSDPWAVDVQSADRITAFEAGYLSERPDYDRIRVRFVAGEQVGG